MSLPSADCHAPRKQFSRLAAALIPWFSINARDLPWRRTRDPYAIWVSEIMLQQTQVKSVVPYWQRWMRALPTIEAVASARLERIHKLWEGLGYYTRARNLQKAAQAILKKRGGKFPRSFGEVLELPGIGRYTAGAVCSIAFNQPTPILDGNVVRVLTRVFGISGNPREPKVNEELWRLANGFVLTAAALQDTAPSTALRSTLHAPRFCSLLNQSLMELGALICTPKQPQCNVCPILSSCSAFQQGRVNELPRRGARPRATPRRFIALVVERRGRFLVRRRPAGVVNAHLWEFPNIEVAREGSVRQVSGSKNAAPEQRASSQRNSPPRMTDYDSELRKAARRLLGAATCRLDSLCTIKHSITRYRITLEVFRAHFDHAAKLAPKEGRWLNRSQMRRLPFASAHKRILACIGAKR